MRRALSCHLLPSHRQGCTVRVLNAFGLGNKRRGARAGWQVLPPGLRARFRRRSCLQAGVLVLLECIAGTGEHGRSGRGRRGGRPRPRQPAGWSGTAALLRLPRLPLRRQVRVHGQALPASISSTALAVARLRRRPMLSSLSARISLSLRGSRRPSRGPLCPVRRATCQARSPCPRGPAHLAHLPPDGLLVRRHLAHAHL